MKVFLIGCGCGRASFTAEAENALSDAELIIGPERLLNELTDELKGIRKEAALPLYRCLKPLWWTRVRDLKKAGNDREAVKRCLDRTEYYLTEDIDFKTYME